MPEYVRRLVEDTFQALQKAIRLSPNSGLALARNAVALKNEITNVSAGEIVFLAQRAAKLAPASDEVRRIRDSVLKDLDVPVQTKSNEVVKKVALAWKPVTNIVTTDRPTLKAIVFKAEEAATRLPLRDPKAPAESLDLTGFYNADPATGWTDGDATNSLANICGHVI